MASLNRTTLIGNLGADPLLRYMPDGSPVATISVATTEKWKDRVTGDVKEETEWHRIVFFKKLAETVAEYLKSGSQVYVEGKLRTRKWTDKDGIERYTTEIVANAMQMLGKKSESTVQRAPSDEVPLPAAIEDDEIPF